VSDLGQDKFPGPVGKAGRKSHCREKGGFENTWEEPSEWGSGVTAASGDIFHQEKI